MRQRAALTFTTAFLAIACSGGATNTAAPPPTASAAAQSAAASQPPATLNTATIAPASVPASVPAATTPPPATAAAGGTTFTLVLADGPREGTWVVTQPAGAVATCSYLPDLKRWLATWLGPPPLSFVDVRGEKEDPFLMFKFTDEADELDFTPSGDVTFEADDRGDTATLTWSSETNEGTSFDASGNPTGSVDMGRADLTIECGQIFRYT